MPIYEYQCSKCDKIFERIVSVADSTKTVFCDCSPKAKAKKIISAPSFRLEGSGWYETDFKTGNKKNLVQSDVKSKKIFQNALRKFFEDFKGTRFDEPATSGNTNSGIGDREDGKEIKENPNVRLNNLTRLYALFEEHVSQPVNRSKNIDIIMAGLKAEIEHLETVFDRKRDKEGQVPNKNMGKKILKTFL